jgi:hypothetical protein
MMHGQKNINFFLLVVYSGGRKRAKITVFKAKHRKRKTKA